MQLWILAFFLGVLLLQFFTNLPNSILLLWFIPIIFIGWYWRKIFWLILAIFLGFAYALLYAKHVSAWSLDHDQERKNIPLSGFIASIPQNNKIFSSFEFVTETFGGKGLQTKLKLSWTGKHPALVAGDKWQFIVRLKCPHGNLNPGGFDLEKYLFAHHIRGTGYVVNSSFNKKLALGTGHYLFTRLRQNLQQKISQNVFYAPLHGILTALVVGDESKIKLDDWQVMDRTGTSYLVAISGLHIGLVASIVFFIVKWLWMRSRVLPLQLPAQTAGIIGAFISAITYSVVSGLSVPTERSLIMLTVFFGFSYFKRNLMAWNAFFLALFLVLLLDPLAVMSIGFWLSFIAVGMIIYTVKGRFILTESGALNKGLLGKIKKFFFNYWKMQIVITLSLLPLSLLLFQHISFIALLANFIALPAVCLVVVPLSLLGSLLLMFPGYVGGWMLWLALKILTVIWLWLSWLANLHFGVWQHSIYNWWTLAFAALGILLLLAPKGFPVKILSGILFLPLLTVVPVKPKPNEVWFTLLDVGQGLSAIIRTQNHTLIYDTGIKQFKTDSGATIVLPFLKFNGIKNIDMLVVSHGDNDHIGGANSILAGIKVSKIATSVPERFLPRKAEFCHFGEEWQWDGVGFKFLYPFFDTNLFGNNASCVLKVTSGKNSILLTGDIEKDAEAIMVEKEKVELKSSILVAPHHGSRTSSTKKFIGAILPEYVLFPIGYLNRFHFPAKVVTKRYSTLKVKMLDTATCGAVTFKLDPQTTIDYPELYRFTHPRFWH